MNIDTILSRIDCKIPFFAQFILNRYVDLKETDPVSAGKIENQIFTPSFLRHHLNRKNRYLQMMLFDHVPASFFRPLTDELVDRFEKGKMAYAEDQIISILKVNAPDRFLAWIEAIREQKIRERPVTLGAFYWMNEFDALPLDLKSRLFEKTLSFFFENQEKLSDILHYDVVLAKLASAAFQLKHHKAGPLARIYLEELIKTDDDYDDPPDENLILQDFLDIFPLEEILPDSQFEPDLFFDLKEGRLKTVPVLLAHLYEDGWEAFRLLDLYNDLVLKRCTSG